MALYCLIKLTASKGRNDEFVLIPPSVIVLALEAMLFNPHLLQPNSVSLAVDRLGVPERLPRT
jgi:hypothetical protein